ncbi:hypothetical protein KP77_13080 [Jeotgalibacillus alimentarius]|uniref:Uncharacterized protein n=1 Tax=Jeotgalibacillus alimentarius TaxID=135826 RepID=A0A0C2W3P9_9BACL|nr:hypothetical protein KP77_13080 [Jeotgalibacillus alimentarius]
MYLFTFFYILHFLYRMIIPFFNVYVSTIQGILLAKFSSYRLK